MTGPFLNDKSGTVIAKFVKDELLVCAKEIRTQAIECSDYRPAFFDFIYSKKLKILEQKYKTYSKRFIELYHRWNTPDVLYEQLNIDPDNPGEFAPAMQDYMNSQQAVMWHFNEGFRLLSYIGKILTEQRNALNNRLSVSVSSLAIIISIIVALLK